MAARRLLLAKLHFRGASSPPSSARTIDRSAGVQTTRATSVRPLPPALFDDYNKRRDRSLALNYSAMKRVAVSSSSISSPKKTATNIHSSYRPPGSRSDTSVLNTYFPPWPLAQFRQLDTIARHQMESKFFFFFLLWFSTTSRKPQVYEYCPLSIALHHHRPNWP